MAKEQMKTAQVQLTELLESNDLTKGMYVRVHGDHLIVGRPEETDTAELLQRDDRVRFTRLGARTYGLSVKRHTGRWEKTPFMGTLQEMTQAVWSVMQHLVAPY